MGELGLVGALIVIILFFYPYVALGRIWLYSKKQARLLEEIKALLQERR